MKFRCEIDNLKTLKKGTKLTLYIEDDSKQVLRDCYNFIDKPLVADIRVDEPEQKKMLEQITPEQRKKIYALFKDIADSTGDDKESVKEMLKYQFVSNSQYTDFSLGDCHKDLANDFIEFIVRFSFENGIGLSESPKDKFDDIEAYMWACVDYKICSICGQHAEIHHLDAIGAGRDRNKVNDSDLRKIALCRDHHAEAHNMGVDSFCEKYHVVGVK